MIYVVDNFLEKSYYDFYSYTIQNNENTEVVMGEKSFYVQKVDEDFIEVVCNILSEKENKTM